MARVVLLALAAGALVGLAAGTYVMSLVMAVSERH